MNGLESVVVRMRCAKCPFTSVGSRSTRDDKWIDVESDEIRWPMDYMDNFDDDAGHIEADEWQADELIDVRGPPKNLEYLVHWAGWSFRARLVGAQE